MEGGKSSVAGGSAYSQFLRARIFLLRGRKILAPSELPLLFLVLEIIGKNQTKMLAGRSVVNHGNKGRPFRLALPRSDYCVNYAER